MANIAFDIDDTLYKVNYTERNGEMIPTGQIPDYDVINLLISLYKLGNKIYVWSAGGTNYAIAFAVKFGIMDFVNIIPKHELSANGYRIDITFDDQIITLGKVNIRIPRNRYEE